MGWLTIIWKLKTLTSFTNHWQKAGAIHSLAWIPQSIQMIFLVSLDGWLIWRGHPCKVIRFLSLLYSSTLWFQAWGKDAGRDTHQQGPFLGYLNSPVNYFGWCSKDWVQTPHIPHLKPGLPYTLNYFLSIRKGRNPQARKQRLTIYELSKASP